MRRPAVNATRIEAARQERVSGIRSTPEIHLNTMAFSPEANILRDDTTSSMQRAYELCTLEWGPNDRWLDVEMRPDGRYRIYQYETGSGDLVEVSDSLRPEVGVLEIDSQRFLDPNFRLSHMHATGANDDLSCIRKGGYRNRSTYQIWKWSALDWLQEAMRDQLLLKSSGDMISVWPALDGYCLNLYGTDVFYQ